MTPGRVVNGEKRWKFEFGNTIYITDELCLKEITCYKKPVKIEHAKITQAMMDKHAEAKQMLADDPQLVSIFDNPSSFENRSDTLCNLPNYIPSVSFHSAQLIQ